MKKLIALMLAAALTVGSAAAITPEEAFPSKNTYPGWRTSWATPASPPPASTRRRAEPSTPGSWSAWGWC